MAGQQQSPLQERDRRFESGSLQQGVGNKLRLVTRLARRERRLFYRGTAGLTVPIHLPPAASPERNLNFDGQSGVWCGSRRIPVINAREATRVPDRQRYRELARKIREAAGDRPDLRNVGSRLGQGLRSRQRSYRSTGRLVRANSIQLLENAR
jgi:hypothetical protein